MWEYNNELYHHGVMGMHWGVRRSSPRASSVERKAKKLTKLAAKENDAAKNYSSKYNLAVATNSFGNRKVRSVS